MTILLVYVVWGGSQRMASGSVARVADPSTDRLQSISIRTFDPHSRRHRRAQSTFSMLQGEVRPTGGFSVVCATAGPTRTAGGPPSSSSGTLNTSLSGNVTY